MQKIHFHNDFDVHLNFTNIKTDYVSRVEFWTRRDDIYCCCKGDNSLKVEDDSNIVCYLNDHNLGTGKLNYNVIFQIPDSNYTDGYKKVCQHYVSDIFLTSENGDTTVAIVKVIGGEEATDLINRLSEFEKVFDNKQDKLNFDNTPTSGSKNVVYSDGIYNAIKNNKPDLTDYAKKSDLQGLATEQWVNDKGYLTSIPDDYITETELDSKGYITSIPDDYAKKSDLQGLATEQWVNDKGYLTEHQSLEGYVTETELDNKGYITSIPDVYVTESELDSKGYLTSIPSDYITETELASKGYITSIPDDYVTETELNSKGYLTEHQSLADYAKKTDLQGLATEQWVTNQGYLTSIPSNYVTESELDSKGYLTEHQSLDDYVKKSDLQNTSVETVTVTPAEDTEYTLNSNQYLRIIPMTDAVKLTFNKSNGTGLMREYHILIDCNTAVPTAEFKGVLWGLDNDPVFEKGKMYDIVIRDDGTNLYGSWKAYKLMGTTILITTSDATDVQLNGTTYNLVAGDNSLTDVELKTITDIGGFNSNNKITSIDFGGTTIKIADLHDKFSYMSNLTKISNIIVKDADDLTKMFGSDTKLKEIDTSNWDNSKATNFRWMFGSCESLTTLDVSNWNTSNVTNFSGMFKNCKSLTTLDVSNWNTSNVTDFSEMFTYCTNLTVLDLSHFDTSNVTNFSWMFNNCRLLKSLDVSNWNTSNVTSFSGMFNNCSLLKSLDVSNWNTSSATDFYSMFSGCNSLTTLDVSKWNTSNVTDFSSMFWGCKLTTLDVSNWNTSNVTDFDRMFNGCNSLTTLDVSNWDTSKATDFSWMFGNCTNLATLDISGWNISTSANINYMFYVCNSLTTIRMVGCSQATIDKINSVKPASATIITE